MNVPSVGAYTTATLPDGSTELGVGIISPAAGDTVFIPVGDPDGLADVPVEGNATITGNATTGGANTTVVYVADGSGSMGADSGADCDGDAVTDTLQLCQQIAFLAANAAAKTNPSITEVGLVIFAAGSASASDLDFGAPVDNLVPPAHDGDTSGNADPDEAIATIPAISVTNFQAALEAVDTILPGANANCLVLFVSDGFGTTGAILSTTITDFCTTTIIQAFALGSIAGCGGVSTDPFYPGNLTDVAGFGDAGSACTEITDPSLLAAALPEAVGATTLNSLELSVDGTGSPIPNTDIAPDLPAPGPVEALYTTTAGGLAPGAHEICVTANGTDTNGDTGEVTECVTIEVVQAVCPHSQGFWKNHADDWPVNSLTLGSDVYSKNALLTLLNTPTRGRADLILAKQLIAAKLNLENNAEPVGNIEDIIAWADQNITGADNEDSDNVLPFGIRSNTLRGQNMTYLAGILDDFNNGILTPGCNADVSVAKSGPATANQTEPVTFTLVVSSNGPGTATWVTLADELPASLGGWTLGGPDAADCAILGDDLACTFGDLPALATRTVTATGAPDVDCAGQETVDVANNATVATTGDDNVAGNNVDSHTVTIQCPADVAVTKEGPTTVESGGNVTYLINVTSNGPATATGVTLSDTLPVTGGVLGGADAASCSIVGAELDCAFGDLAPGETRSITVEVTLTGCDDVDNTAFVETTAFELAVANNASAHTVTVSCPT